MQVSAELCDPDDARGIKGWPLAIKVEDKTPFVRAWNAVTSFFDRLSQNK
jgi:hypothetical protein